MRRIIFYSWQSDLPNASNRGFIQAALEKAAATIVADNSVEVEPVVDRDIQGVAGAPDIGSTIFAKITASDIFVADISIISQSREGRSTPNPNVLIELGYALKTLGHERIILVFNRAFGKIEELPFDLRTRFVIAYDMPEESERAAERKRLEGLLETAIRAALAQIPANTPSISIPAVDAIENVRANRIVVLRRNLDTILKKLEGLEPKRYSAGGTIDELLAAIEKTQEPVAEFSKIAEIISIMNDYESAIELYQWFGKIFEHYDCPKDFKNGKTSNADYDYFMFIGHELFTTLIAFLLREKRWDILNHLLDEPVPVPYLFSKQGPANVDWDFAIGHCELLSNESKKKGRISLRADILQGRHGTGGLAAVLPFEEFFAADILLYLRGAIVSKSEYFMLWPAWTIIWAKNMPNFFRDAESIKTAEQLAKLMKVETISELKVQMKKTLPDLSKLSYSSFRMPFTDTDIDRIGTR